MYKPPRPTVSTAPNTMPSRGGSGLIFGSFTAKIPQISAPSARISPTNPRPPTLYPPSPDARKDWLTAVQNTTKAVIDIKKDKIPVGECFKSLIRVFRVRRKYFLLLLAIRCLLNLFAFSAFWHRHPGPAYAASAHKPDTLIFHRLYSGKYRPHQNSRFWL